jgi:glycosyltransferase involved in cell wall biosynthesis
MACGIPVVASAVGVNRVIVQDGINGFLASSHREWVEKLGWLLSDAALREKLGRSGRETIVERYSLTAQAPVLAGVLEWAAGA